MYRIEKQEEVEMEKKGRGIEDKRDRDETKYEKRRRRGEEVSGCKQCLTTCKRGVMTLIK